MPNKTNWGAGLQALSGSLLGLYQDQVERQRQAQLRQQTLADRATLRSQQLADEADRRAYEAGVLADTRRYNESLDPMMQLPAEQVTVPSLLPGMVGPGFDAPNPNRPAFLPQGVTEMRRSEFNKGAMDYAGDNRLDARQAARDRATLERELLVEALRGRNRLDERRLSLSFGDELPKPSAFTIKNFVTNAVSDNEAQMYGPDYVAAVEIAAGDAANRGAPLDNNTAAWAKAQALSSMPNVTPDLSFGMRRRTDILGQPPLWYNPAVQNINEGTPQTGSLWWKKPEVVGGSVTPFPGATGKALVQGFAPALSDSMMVVDKVAPMLRAGKISAEDLNQLVGMGMSAADINRWLGLAATIPDTPLPGEEKFK